MFKIQLKEGIYREVFNEKLDKVLRERKISCSDTNCCKGGLVHCKGCVFDSKDDMESLSFEELGVNLSSQEVEINGVMSSDILSQNDIMDLFLEFCDNHHISFGGKFE